MVGMVEKSIWMNERQIRTLVSNVASELSMQGFVLEHEQSKLNRSTLYECATKLEDLIAALLRAAAHTEKL